MNGFSTKIVNIKSFFGQRNKKMVNMVYFLQFSLCVFYIYFHFKHLNTISDTIISTFAVTGSTVMRRKSKLY